MSFYQKSLEQNLFEQKSLDQKSQRGQDHATFDAKEKFFALSLRQKKQTLLKNKTG